MKNPQKLAVTSLIVGAILASLPSTHCAERTADSLATAIKTGEFATYLVDLTTGLNEKVAARTLNEWTETSLTELLEDPAVANTLNQRELISRTGPDELGAFAKADPANQAFLHWLLSNTEAMDLYLEACVPLGLAAREANNHKLSVAPLAIWKKIIEHDPDAKEGLYLKLAIATAIAPPGSVNIGAGGAATPADPVTRYQYFKTAHGKKELFPSFDKLSVWEYSTILCSGASDEDLTWAREMVNTFRPDLRVDEMVVNSTSFVWRRNAPAPFWPFNGTFKNVLAGGGKCGPRSSWSQMVCHAFGVPCVGVGQPGHACAAFKAANPMVEPQPGSAWKVAFGAGWHKSKVQGLAGPDFLAGVAERERAESFSQVEHLRWLASALDAKEQAAAVMEVAHKIQKTAPITQTDVKAVEPAANPDAEASTAKTTVPFTAVDGVIRVEAAAFTKTGGENSWGGQIPHVLVHDCFTGGKQVYFQQQMKSQWADYTLDVPASGTYEITLQAACVNVDQALEVCSGDEVIAAIPIPLSYGLWQQTQPVKVKLSKGVQTLRVQTPTTEHMRGIAVRSFELKSSGT